jgi:tRNA G18 (ribose-2'-O)-methylase SpoU
MQLNHYATNFDAKIFPIIVVCDNVTNAPNIGSLFRTADAFGVAELIFCGDQIPLGRKMTKTSRATEKSVRYRQESDVIAIVSDLKSQGYCIVSLEITSKSEALVGFKFPKNTPIALIIGDENFGVSASVLNLSNAIVHIDMFGQNSSMNVVHAASVTLYEITKQLKPS